MEQDSTHVAKVVGDELVVVKEEVAVKEEVLVVEASTSKVVPAVVKRPRPSRWEIMTLKDYLKLGGRRSKERPVTSDQ